MMPMTSSRAAAGRIVLVRDTPRGSRRPAPVRRYRLVRLPVTDRTPSPEDRVGRFSHLKRTDD